MLMICIIAYTYRLRILISGQMFKNNFRQLSFPPPYTIHNLISMPGGKSGLYKFHKTTCCIGMPNFEKSFNGHRGIP